MCGARAPASLVSRLAVRLTQTLGTDDAYRLGDCNDRPGVVERRASLRKPRRGQLPGSPEDELAVLNALFLWVISLVVFQGTNILLLQVDNRQFSVLSAALSPHTHLIRVLIYAEVR